METAVATPGEALLRELEAGHAEPARPEALRGRELRGAWIRATTLWGLLGLAFPATALALIATGSEPAGFELAVLVAAGALQGLCLGVGQSLALSRGLPALRKRAWTGQTALGAAVAWIAGAVPVAASIPFGSGIGGGDIAILGVLTLVAVAAIGAAQWFELRHTLLRAEPWLLMSALAWLAGIGVIALAVAVSSEGQPVLVTAALGFCAAVVATFVVAVLTGLSLSALVSADDRARERRRAEYVAETAWLLRTVDRVKRSPRRERLRASARRRG